MGEENLLKFRYHESDIIHWKDIHEERQLTTSQDYLIHSHGFNYYLRANDSQIYIHALDPTQPSKYIQSPSFLNSTSYVYLKCNNFSSFLNSLLVQPLIWPHFHLFFTYNHDDLSRTQFILLMLILKH